MPITGLVVPVSGPYAGTWDGYSLGTQNDDGFILLGSYTGQEVNQSDAYGMTLVEAIWRGINWRMRFRGLEWNKPGILASMQAFGSTGQPNLTFTPTGINEVGNRYTLFAQPLLLVSELGEYPPSIPNTLTALGAVVAPQTNVEYLMTSKVREAPFEMVLLPYEETIGSLSNEPVAFTTT
jgi:hypothetical protein